MLSNPTIDWLDGLMADGLSISAVTIKRRSGGWRAIASINVWLPSGEGADQVGPEDSRYTVNVDREHMPDGVTLRGWDRWPAQSLDLPPASEEQIETLIREIAELGGADDWARYEAEDPSYPHYLTKPRGDRWYSGPA